MRNCELALALRSGGDPLGDRFVAEKSSQERRHLGATYTPAGVIDSMMAWARSRGTPERVVDPGAGTGRFSLAAAKAFPNATILAVEIDPEAATLLLRNVAAAGLSHRVEIVLGDYRDLRLPAIEGRTLFIGNPPYVRHHDIEPRFKEWYATTATGLGFPASRLAGLHLHFFVKTREIARDGDFGAFITAAEWLDVNYGHTLRSALLNGMGGLSVDLFPADVAVFDGAMTTAAITCFEIGSNCTAVAFGAPRGTAGLLALGSGRRVAATVLAAEGKWSRFARGEPVPIRATANAENRLGDLFRVKRGQVTGLNKVWVAGEQAGELPERLLRPTVTKARELIESGAVLRNAAALRRVVDLPADLSVLNAGDRDRVDRFLHWAKGRGADHGYIARHRNPWWAVKLYEPAPILCTYMARRAPVFVRNLCGARHINIAHGLYPRETVSSDLLDAIVAWLNTRVRRDQGRTYAGGLTKFEPREVERLPIPPVGELLAT